MIGLGADAILDFVGEKGAVEDAIAMLQDGGFYYVIGYGQTRSSLEADTYTDLEDRSTRSPTSMKDGCTAAASSCPREAADMGRARARASDISGTGHRSP